MAPTLIMTAFSPSDASGSFISNSIVKGEEQMRVRSVMAGAVSVSLVALFPFLIGDIGDAQPSRDPSEPILIRFERPRVTRFDGNDIDWPDSVVGAKRFETFRALGVEFTTDDFMTGDYWYFLRFDDGNQALAALSGGNDAIFRIGAQFSDDLQKPGCISVDVSTVLLDEGSGTGDATNVTIELRLLDADGNEQVLDKDTIALNIDGPVSDESSEPDWTGLKACAQEPIASAEIALGGLDTTERIGNSVALIIDNFKLDLAMGGAFVKAHFTDPQGEIREELAIGDRFNVTVSFEEDLPEDLEFLPTDSFKIVTLRQNGKPGDVESLELEETGPDTGIYHSQELKLVETGSNTGVVRENGSLELPPGDEIQLIAVIFEPNDEPIAQARVVSSEGGPGPSPPPAEGGPALKQFDTNDNNRIDDPEFFDIIDAWVAAAIADDDFFTAIDLWISQEPISSAGLGRDLFPSRPVSLATSSTPSGITFRVDGLDVSRIDVEIFDLAGRRVYAERSLGSQLAWNLNSDNGSPVANGVYLYSARVYRYDGRVVQAPVEKLLVLR